ncbi:MAG: hypothetical protein WD426_09125 [Anditalea sp.]
MFTKKTMLKIILTISVLYIVHKMYTNHYESLEKRYTIGELGNIYKPYGQDFNVKIKFNFYDEKINLSYPMGNNKIKTKNYLIEVPIKDIKKSRILWDYPVPDTLKAPFEGWKEIPEFLKKSE